MNVLLHVDDSTRWHPAALLARALARHAGGRVTVISTHVRREKGAHAVASAVRFLDLPADRVSTRLHPGIAELVLPAEAARGGHHLLAFQAGGVLDRLMNAVPTRLVTERAPVSTLVVRGRPKSVTRILLATAGPRQGTDVVRAAVDVAAAFDASLTVLHVRSQLGVTAESSAAVDAELRDFLTGPEPAAEHLRAACATARAEGVDAVAKVRVGLVVEEVLDEVKEGPYDLLVLGAHEVRGRTGLLHEDVTAILLAAAPTSCIVVRNPLTGAPPPPESR